MDAITLDQLEKIYAVRYANVSNAAENASFGDKTNANMAQQARQQALFDTAISLGLKAGIHAQLSKINEGIEKNTIFLDKVYNFEPYLISQRVVPPVITEARNLYNQSGDSAVRLSGVMYTIERQARMTSTAPNWREYLNFPVMKDGFNNPSLLPRNQEEMDVWQKALRQGWFDGITQANDMLQQSLDRLNRDFIGILRFHRFVLEGKVTLPVIAESKMDVSKSQGSMVVDEQLLRLTVLPDFQSSISQWKAPIQSSQASTQDYMILKKNKDAINATNAENMQKTKKAALETGADGR